MAKGITDWYLKGQKVNMVVKCKECDFSITAHRINVRDVVVAHYREFGHGVYEVKIGDKI